MYFYIKINYCYCTSQLLRDNTVVSHHS